MRVHRLIYSISYRAPSLNMRLIFLNPHERSYAKGLVVRWISLRFFFVMPLVSNKTVEITSPIVQLATGRISFEWNIREIPWNIQEKLKKWPMLISSSWCIRNTHNHLWPVRNRLECRVMCSVQPALIRGGRGRRLRVRVLTTCSRLLIKLIDVPSRGKIHSFLSSFSL